jgi:hypothetical protein
MTNTAPLRVRARRRLVLGAGVVALAAAAVLATIVAPQGTPVGPDPAAAAVLNHLANRALGRGGADVGPQQYAYFQATEEQTVSPSTPVLPGRVRDGNMQRHTYEQWTAPDGELWFVDDPRQAAEACISHHQPSQGGGPLIGNYEDATAAQLSALPTDPPALRAYLDDHPTGQNRGSRNLFLAISDLVRSGLASANLRAATIRVLADTPDLSVDERARDALGRSAIQVDYPEGSSTETLFFDARTTLVLEDRISDSSHALVYQRVFTQSGVVDRLPSDLPACPTS